MRPARTRLTVCLAAAAATTAVGMVTAPAATADPNRGTTVLYHLSNSTQSNVPNISDNVPPFGRKIS